METNTINNRARAKERLKELKGFYSHLGFYVVINIFLTVAIVSGEMDSATSFFDAFFNFGTFAIWFFWGIGLVGHAIKVFSFNPFFGKGWEERQIEKYMEEERIEANKYKS